MPEPKTTDREPRLTSGEFIRGTRIVVGRELEALVPARLERAAQHGRALLLLAVEQQPHRWVVSHSDRMFPMAPNSI